MSRVVGKQPEQVCAERKFHMYTESIGRCALCGKANPAKKPRAWSREYLDFHYGYRDEGELEPVEVRPYVDDDRPVFYRDPAVDLDHLMESDR